MALIVNGNGIGFNGN